MAMRRDSRVPPFDVSARDVSKARIDDVSSAFSPRVSRVNHLENERTLTRPFEIRKGGREVKGDGKLFRCRMK